MPDPTICPKSGTFVTPDVENDEGNGIAFCPGCTMLVATRDGELAEHFTRMVRT